MSVLVGLYGVLALAAFTIVVVAGWMADDAFDVDAAVLFALLWPLTLVLLLVAAVLDLVSWWQMRAFDRRMRGRR